MPYTGKILQEVMCRGSETGAYLVCLKKSERMPLRESEQERTGTAENGERMITVVQILRRFEI